MADGDDDLELRFTADSSGLRPEIEGLRAELKELRSNLDALTGDLRSNASATRELTAVQSLASREAERAALAGERFIAQLKQQAETVGMSRSQLLSYKAEQYGVTEAARAQIERIDQQTRSLRQNREAVAAVGLQLQALEEIQAKHAQAQFNVALGVGSDSRNSARASASVFEAHFEEQALAAKKLAAAEADLERRTISLRESLDPLAAAQNRLSTATRNADELLSHHKITLAEHGRYVDRLKSEYDRLDKAMSSGRGMAMSGHQLQMLALQIPDVVQQLLMGQPAWQVFLQQGGQGVQIMGMGPGGMGAALRALTSPLALTVGALGGVGVAAAAVGYTMHQGREEQVEFARSLQVVGSMSGITERQIFQLAETTARDLGKSAKSVREVELALVRTGKVSGDILPLMTEGTELYARAMGGKAVDAIDTFLPLLGDTAGAAMVLNERFHTLTATQIEHIAKLQEQGQKQEAVRYAMEALVSPMRNQQENLGVLEKSWRGLGMMIDSAIDSMRAWGREKVAETQLDKADGAIEDWKKRRDLLANKKTLSDAGTVSGRGAFTSEDADNLRHAEAQMKAWGQIRDSLKASGDAARDLKNREAESGALIERHLPQAARLRALKEDEAKLVANIRDGIGDTVKQEAVLAAIRSEQKTIRNKQAGIKSTGSRQEYLQPQSSKDEAGLRDSIDGLFNDRALEAAKAYWAERLQIETKGSQALKDAGKTRSREYADLEQARINARAKLDEVERRMDMRALQLQQVRTDAETELERARVAASTAEQVEVIEARIRAKEGEIQVERRFTPENLKALKDLYSERLRILNEAVDAETALLRRQLEARIAISRAEGNDASVLRDEAALKQIDFDAAIKKSGNSRSTQKKGDDATNRSIDIDVERFRRRATQVGDVWRTTVEGMVNGTMTWRDAVMNAERGMLSHGLKMGQQWLTEYLARKRAEVLIAKSADDSKVASEKAAAIAAGQVSFKSSLGSIFNDAKTAAGAAYKATAGIPIVGPVLAPAAGAAAYAGVMAMSTGLTAFSAERGAASVPFDNAPFLLHKEEMVLPAELARPLRSMLRGGQGNSVSNSTTNNQVGGDTFNVRGGRNMSDDDIVAAIVRAKKRGKLGARALGIGG